MKLDDLNRKMHAHHESPRYILLFLLLLSMISCGRGTTTPVPTPTFTPSSPPPTATLQPTFSPTLTGIPLPKEPVLLSLIGKGRVYDTAWSPDRQAFAVSASDAVRVYQAKTRRVLTEFPAHDWAYLQFSPDGQKLAGIPDGGDIRIYDLQTRQIVSQVSIGTTLVNFAFKPDGSGFAVSKYFFMNLADPGLSWVEVYDLHADKPKYQFDYDPEFQSKDGGHDYAEVSFSPDGLRLSAADMQTGRVRTWDLTNGQQSAFHLAHPQVTSISYSPDGRWLASAGGDNQVRLWNTRTGSLVRKLTGFSNHIQDLSFSTDSTQLAVKTEGESAPATETFEVLTGQKIDTPTASTAPDEIQAFLSGEGYMKIISLPSFSPDSRTLAIQNGDQLVLWDLQAQRQQTVLDTKISSSAVFTPDGKQLAVPQLNGSVDLWDMNGGRKVKNIPSHKATTVAFSADGKYMVVGGEQAVELWDVQSRQRLWQTYASGLSIQAVGFSPDGQTILAASSSGRAVLWLDFRDGQIRQSFHPNASDPGSMTIAFQGRLLAAVKPFEPGYQAVSSSDLNQAVRVWDLSTGQVLKDIDNYKTKANANYFRFSPDGRLIAGQGEGNSKVWSTVTGEELFAFPKEIQDPVFSPDQQLIVLPDDQGRLQVWDARALLDAPQLPAPASGPLPTAAPALTALPGSGLKTQCLAVQPTRSPGRQLQGQLVMHGTVGTPDYLLDLKTGGQQPLPDHLVDLTVSPNGEWLAYTLYSDNRAEKYWLVFQDPAGKQRKYPIQGDWLFPKWMGSDWLSYSIRIDYGSQNISPTQIISPLTGPYRRLVSNYPDLKPYSGLAGSPYHYSGHSVEYDPSLRLVVYEKTDEKYNTSMVLYDRQSGKELASLPDFYGEHYWNNPTWSADGQFFIAALIKDYQPNSGLGQEEWFRISRDGSVEQLTHFQDLPRPVDLGGGSLSPDGKKLAFYLMGQTYADQSLAVLDLDSKTVTNLCLRNDNFGGVTWSPDSRYLVAAEEYEANNFRTLLIDLVNNQAEQIVDDNHAVPAGWLNSP